MDWTPGVETTITRGFVDLSSKVPIGHVKRRVDEHIGEARGAQGHLRQGCVSIESLFHLSLEYTVPRLTLLISML